MTDSSGLQRQLDGLLTGKPHRPAQVDTDALTAGAAERTRWPFSAFRLADLWRANTLTAEWMTLAQSAQITDGREGAVQAVLGQAAQILATENPDLVRFALKSFITHYRHGTGLHIRPIEHRHPEKVLPAGPGPATNPELALAWWREDPKLAEHHEHWHIVYNIAGVPAPGTPSQGEPKDRQGELFFYMHRQMLARYDTERLALGLPRVEPWDDLAAADEWGYDPGPYLSPYYSPRPPAQTMQDIAAGCAGEYAHSLSRLAAQWQRFEQAVTDGYFLVSDGLGGQRKVPLDMHVLGSTLEADIGSVERIPFDAANSDQTAAIMQFLAGLSQGDYGDVHNDGHDFFAAMSTEPCTLPGVMTDTTTAVRDPIFYRWHRRIDNLGCAWENQQPPHDFGDAPSARLRHAWPEEERAIGRSPDIILAFRADIPAEWTDDLQGYGEAVFGGEHWDRDFTASDMTTAELRTRMLTRTISVEPGREPGRPAEASHTISYLDQDEFVYFIRIENLAPEPRDVTLRLFLAPLAAADDRRMWIELDKFRWTLNASERAVVCRPAWLSSVIRKPGVKPPDADQPGDMGGPGGLQGAGMLDDNYCDCGWPYNLLLPRGTREGMPFRLLVMATDWELDQVEMDSCCGSMSYCGAKDRYPDARPMGYPFDRPFAPERPIEATLAAHGNIAARDITIRWVE